MDISDILRIFEKTGALLKGHFLLTSGLHSNIYFQCAKVLQHPAYTEQLCTQIVNNFKNTEIDTVISPAIGGIVVGQEVGRQLNKKTVFAERAQGKMTLRRGFSLEKDEKVLVCEDVVTTGGSVIEVIDLVKGYGGKVVGIGLIVDRSNGKVKFKAPQFSCMQLKAETFKPENCAMCNSGDRPVKPGSRNINTDGV